MNSIVLRNFLGLCGEEGNERDHGFRPDRSQEQEWTDQVRRLDFHLELRGGGRVAVGLVDL